MLSIAVPKPELDIWAEIANQIPSIGVFSFEVDRGGELILKECVENSDEYTPFFFGIACAMDRNVALANALKSDKRFFSIFSNASVFDLAGSDSRSDLAFKIIGAMSRFFGPAARYGAEQALAMSSLRQEYERLHLRFSELESYVQQAGIGLVRQKLCIEPVVAADAEGLYSDISCGHFTQLLPVASKGLCALGFKLKLAERPSPSNIGVELFLGDEDAPEASWVVDFNKHPVTPDGWFSLMLPRAIEGIARRATVHFHTETSQPDEFALALGRVVANERFRLRDQFVDAPVSSRSAAMRIWEAPPGCQAPGLPDIAAMGQGEERDKDPAIRLSAVSLQKARPADRRRALSGEAVVRYLPEEDCIAMGVASPYLVAVIDRVVPADAAWISSQVRIDAPSEARLEAAIGLSLVAGSKAAIACPAGAPPNVVAWSGWSVLKSGVRRQLSIAMPAACAHEMGAFALVLMTRSAGPHSDELGRVKFSEIQIDRI